jgi:hypothetical protein
MFDRTERNHDSAADHNPVTPENQPELSTPLVGYIVTLKDEKPGRSYDADAFKKKLIDYVTQNGLAAEVSKIESLPAIGIVLVDCTARVAERLAAFKEVQAVEPEQEIYLP